MAESLEALGCEIVGRAMNGTLALQLLRECQPDLVTLDLNMPEVDGYTFLRVASKLTTTPIVVVTGDDRPESALTALDLGACDFLLKPTRAQDFGRVAQAIAARAEAFVDSSTLVVPPSVMRAGAPQPLRLVVVMASTGGPSLLRDLFSRMPGPPRVPMVVVQHMPAAFTAAFAMRLGRLSGLPITEATDGEVLSENSIRVCRGGMHTVFQAPHLLAVKPVEDGSRWVPSCDLLLHSAIKHHGAGVLAVVLSGMGRDGAHGARALRDCGGLLWAESAETAVIAGMPDACSDAFGGAPRMPIDAIVAQLTALVCGPSDVTDDVGAC
jgi:two-component system, chemotaxis family, protein-glutamate methylesterase/glutaminase